MPRVARIVIPGCTYHLTQRGNNRQDVFFVDDDRRLYLRILAEECRAHGLDVLAYCLMGNHVHLVATAAGEQSLAKGFGRANFRYAQAVNRLHGRWPLVLLGLVILVCGTAIGAGAAVLWLKDRLPPVME